MFNFLYKLGSFYFTKPSLHNLQPKSMNVYFKHSLDKKYTFINLNDCSAVDLQIIVNKDSGDNKYSLVFNKVSFDGYNTQHNVAIFESKERAYQALEILKIKMFSPEKSLIKFSIVVFALVFMWGVLLDIALLNVQKMSSIGTSPTQQVGQLPQIQQQGVDLNTMLNQIQNNPNNVAPPAPIESQPPVQPTAPLAIPQESSNPNVNNFLESLQK